MYTVNKSMEIELERIEKFTNQDLGYLIRSCGFFCKVN